MKSKSIGIVIAAVCLSVMIGFSGCVGCETDEDCEGGQICKDSECVTEEKTLGLFVGGTDGIVGEFKQPTDLYEEEPFEVDFYVENKGEFDVAEGELQVYLGGVNWGSYKEGATSVISDANIQPLSKVEKLRGKATMGGTDDIIFSDLTVPPATAGQTVTFRATMCYPFESIGAADVCIGVSSGDASDCEPSGDKPVDSSGGPVQVTRIEESTSGRDDAMHTFRIYFENKGPDGGAPYIASELDTDKNCNNGLKAPDKGKVIVKKISLDGTAVDIADEKTSCDYGDAEIKRMSGEEGVITCRIHGGEDPAYKSLMRVTLSYNYYDPSTIKDYTIQGY